MSRAEIKWAWAAGLFEGEGCVTRCGAGPILQIRMCDEDVLLRFQEIVGGAVYGPYKTKQGGGRAPARWRKHYYWYAGGPLAREIAGRFFWYMGRRRSEKMRKVFK